MSRTSALTRKPKGLGRRNFAQGSHATPGHMRLPHRLQGQKVKSQGGGDLAAQLVIMSRSRQRTKLLYVEPVLVQR